LFKKGEKMKISKKMEKELNKQINAELYSAYIYLAMSAWFEASNLSGFAHWMRLQAKEEEEHALKFYHFIFERGGQVELDVIKKPVKVFTSALDIFEKAYEHEKKVTVMINDLVDVARKEKDKATEQFLDWFIAEQVEEEASAEEIVQKLRLLENSSTGLLMLDNKLGERKD
jgi:ferritin